MPEPAGVRDAVDLRNKSYVAVDGLRFLDVYHCWVTMQENSSHNIISGCYMEEASGWGGVWLEGESHYNKIVGNTFGWDDETKKNEVALALAEATGRA